MNVKDAVKCAITNVAELFQNETITNLGLEEVEYSDGQWLITVGFSRPWDYPQDFSLANMVKELPKRNYKIVTINDQNQKLIAIKNRNIT